MECSGTLLHPRELPGKGDLCVLQCSTAPLLTLGGEVMVWCANKATCLGEGDSQLRVRAAEAGLEHPADPSLIHPCASSPWHRLSITGHSEPGGASGSQPRHSQATHIFCLPFPIRRQSDVPQAGDKAPASLA